MRQEYKEWLMHKASSLVFPNGPYSQLFEYLYSVEFNSNVGNDRNRISDGLDLRARFVDETPKWTHRDMLMYLMNRPCSVLEMMLALAYRCERDIMYDSDWDDRTGVWFISMLNNLGLLDMTDANYDQVYVAEKIDIFLAHAYTEDGLGGLFPVHKDGRDMREEEIWNQMCWYLDEIVAQLQ